MTGVDRNSSVCYASAMDRSDKQEILDAIAAVGAKVDRLDGDVRELRGPIGVIQTWLQSVDNRFVALMHPFERPTPAGKRRA